MNDAILDRLERRLGRVHARQRLGVEADHEDQIFGQGLNFFHIENWYSVHSAIRVALMASGLYWRGRRNAADLQVRHNTVSSRWLPAGFDGFTVLHISDLHVEQSEAALRRLVALVPSFDYDLCVLTGDYRGPTHGPYDAALAFMQRLMDVLRGPVYGVLGNHDTIRMVPGLEDMGIRMLLNENVPVARDGETIYLAGIDDAHFFRMDNIERAATGIPHAAFSILLSHTPETYRQADHAGFDLLLSGHTHGGQICFPGSIPLTLSAALPRAMGAGAWKYDRMVGYTSTGAGTAIVPVRLNCPPEITLHHLRRVAGQ